MATGLWTAVSGAAAQAQNLDVVANNLANADTLAFKKDATSFKEYLSTLEREPAAQEVPRGPIKDKDLHPLDGRDQSFVAMTGTHTNFKQGNLKVTQAPLDMALDGPGFFEVATPQGIRFTRMGSFKVAADGRLVTSDGHPVLAAQPGGAPPPTRAPASLNGLPQAPAPFNPNDPAVTSRYINLRDRGANFSVAETGELYAGADLIAKLGVSEFADTSKLRKVGSQLFENKDPSANPPISFASNKTIVHQGVLETSNVNPIEEMTNLIKANRLFEHDLKALKTYGDLLGREANDVGKL